MKQSDMWSYRYRAGGGSRLAHTLLKLKKNEDEVEVVVPVIPYETLKDTDFKIKDT
jgi:hypothetical protein